MHISPLIQRHQKNRGYWFNPTHIPGCKLWLNASAFGGVKSGNAAQLASANSESLSITDIAQSGLDPLTSDFAFAGFAYFDTNFAAIRSLVGHGATSDIAPNDVGYWIYANTDGTLRVRFGEGGSNRIANNGNTVLSVATWYFITLNFDRDGNMTVRINDAADTAVDISAQPGSMDSAQAFRLGSTGGGGSFMNGRMHSWIMTNRLITAAEQTWLYNAGSGRRFEDFGQAGTDGVDLTVAGGIVSGWKLGEESGQRNDYFATNHLTDNNTVTQNNGVALVDAVDRDYVRQWTDLSGNVYNFTQTGNVTTKPLFKTAIVNGKSVIRFDGTDDDLINAIKANWRFLHDGTDWTAFIVWAATSSNPNALMGLMGNSNTSQVGFEIGYTDVGGNPDALRMRIVNNTPAAIVSIISNNTWANPDVFKILAVHYDNGAAGNDANLYKDGALVAGADTTGAHSAVDSFANLTIGRFGSGISGTFLAGDFSEIVIFNRALNARELSRFHQYFSRKYSIAVS